MNDAAVNVALKFVDQATAPMKNALGQIEKNTGGIASELNNAFSKINQLYYSFLAGTAIAGVVGFPLKIAADQEKGLFQMSETFKSRTSEMVANAKNMTEQFRHYYDLTEVEYAFTKTADSMERYGIVGAQYLNLVDRAADVGASKNLELKESIDRIESAMRGEAEASEYLGLTLNDTYMKTMAFGGALRDKWEKLNDTTKAYYRYHEMMRQSEKYEGAVERATGTLTGALSSLWGTIKDRLSPSFATLTGHLARFVNLINQGIMSPRLDDRIASLQSQIAVARQRRATTVSPLSPWYGPDALDQKRQMDQEINGAMDASIQNAQMELRDLRRAQMSLSMKTVTPIAQQTGLPSPPPGGDQYIDNIKKTGGAAKEAAKAIEEERQAILRMEETKAKAIAESHGAIYGKFQEGAMDAGIRTGGVFNAQAEARYERHVEILEEGRKAYEDMRTPLEQYVAGMERLNYLLGYGAINQETYTRATRDLADQFDETRQKAKAAAESIQQSLGSGLYNVLKGDFDNIGTAFTDMLLRMIAEAQAAQLAKWMFGDLVGGSGSGLFGAALTSLIGLFGGGSTSGGGVGTTSSGQIYRHAKGDYWFTEPTVAVGLRTGRRHIIAEAGQAEYLEGPNPKRSTTVVQPKMSVRLIVDPNLKLRAEEGPTREESEGWVKDVHLRALVNDEGYLAAHRSFIGGR